MSCSASAGPAFCHECPYHKAFLKAKRNSQSNNLLIKYFLYLAVVANVADGGGSYQACHQDSEHTYGMFCRHGEDVLDEEGVELHHLPDQHQLDDGHQPHVAGLRI